MPLQTWRHAIPYHFLLLFYCLNTSGDPEAMKLYTIQRTKAKNSN